ncbi:LOW QUALITY PROTEIN: hypothetical protein PHMEG_00037545 [Phytophthora megakarya]|uniref:Uncharacterized protein n=1 Tax=Phytophthora megakarya TaxID=4795 RepID=A0A225UJQ0_9STRA|nr:LOW QUALITY PROTEIN: hypothetical protein PHMEG_00037545 [Phytophthora megakarya]
MSKIQSYRRYTSSADHGSTGVPPPIVGVLDSGKPDPASSRILLIPLHHNDALPGFSGGSGFHRESQEEVQVKTEQGNEMSSDARSTTSLLNARSADRQSARRNSVDGMND